MEGRFKVIALWVLGLSMVLVGLMHFVRSDFFLQIMPPYLPWHLELVYLSGVFEILGGVGLLIPRTQGLAAWGLVALFIAVYPANIHMVVNNVPIDGEHLHPVLLWGRLPFQLVFIAWAWWFTRPSRPDERGHSVGPAGAGNGSAEAGTE